MSDRDLERGPQGDHGQHGDTGQAGAAGVAGATGPQGERGRTASPVGAGLRLAAYIILVAAVVYTTSRTFELGKQNQEAIQQIELQRISSRHQICLSDEREHLQSVNSLKATYEYLDGLPDEAFEPTSANAINLAVLRSLPEREMEARNDVAPAFCDETLPGGKAVGLPEPDPVVPKRPDRINELMRDLREG